MIDNDRLKADVSHDLSAQSGNLLGQPLAGHHGEELKGVQRSARPLVAGVSKERAALEGSHFAIVNDGAIHECAGCPAPSANVNDFTIEGLTDHFFHFSIPPVESQSALAETFAICAMDANVDFTLMASP